MNFKIAQVLQWARRVRDFLVGHVLKSEVAELTNLRQELDDAIGQLTANAAAQEAITKQSRVQTTEIERLRTALRDGHLKPIVRMSRTMKLQINGTDITFVLPATQADSERLASAGDAMVTALKEVGPQFIARGFASNVAEQLSNATKALRDAVDQRAAQVSQRTGVTAAMERDGVRLVKLVRVIDTLVRPVIKTDPELLAAWDNVVSLPRPSKGGGAAATPAAPAPATETPAPTSPSSTTPTQTPTATPAQDQQKAA